MPPSLVIVANSTKAVVHSEAQPGEQAITVDIEEAISHSY